MHIFNYINNRLEEKSFHIVNNNELDSLAITLYLKDDINVLVKYYIDTPSLEQLANDSLEAREILLNNNMNIWNSYFFVSMVKNENLDETNYILEREKTALRKYIIQQMEDLDRIPFLDNLNSSKDKKSYSDSSINEESAIVKKVLSLIENQNGREEKISNKNIENIVTELIEEVNHLEDKQS